MIENESDLPDDIPALKSLVLDLSRRLQNAQHTIEAERKTTQLALQQAADYRLRISETVQSFRLESSRIRNTDYKLTRQQEAKKFEENKAKGSQLYEKVKMAELDHQMTGLTRIVPLKLSKLRNQLKSFEDQQSNLKILLQHYSEIDETNDLFMNCVQHNQIEDCIQLINQGVDVNYVDSAGYIALHYACSQGYYEIAQLLLQSGSDHSAYLTGYAPIVLAAKQGYINIIRLLLDFGADIEEKGRLGMPAIIAAAENQQFSTVEFLISLGANIHAYDFQENSILHTVCKIIPMDRNNNITLNQETMNGNANTIGNFLIYLLELGVDVLRVNRINHTPLQVALHAKNQLAIQILNDWFAQHPELTNPPPQPQDVTATDTLEATEGSKIHKSGGRSGLLSGTKSSSHWSSSSASSSTFVKDKAKKFLPSHITSRQAIFTSRGGKTLPQPLPSRVPVGRKSVVGNKTASPLQSLQSQPSKEEIAFPDKRNPDPQDELQDQTTPHPVLVTKEAVVIGGALLEEDDPDVLLPSQSLQPVAVKAPDEYPHRIVNPLLATQSVASSVTFDYA